MPLPACQLLGRAGKSGYDVVACGRLLINQKLQDLRMGQHLPAVKAEFFHNRTAATEATQNSKAILGPRNADHEGVAVGVEVQAFAGQGRSDLDHVIAGGLGNRVRPAAQTEVVGVVVAATLHQIVARTGGEFVLTIVKAAQQVVALGTLDHPGADVLQREGGAIGEQELFDLARAETLDDPQLVAAFGQGKDQVVALARDKHRVRIDADAKDYAVERAVLALAVLPFGDAIKVIIQSKGVGITKSTA